MVRALVAAGNTVVAAGYGLVLEAVGYFRMVGRMLQEGEPEGIVTCYGRGQ